MRSLENIPQEILKNREGDKKLSKFYPNIKASPSPRQEMKPGGLSIWEEELVNSQVEIQAHFCHLGVIRVFAPSVSTKLGHS